MTACTLRRAAVLLGLVALPAFALPVVEPAPAPARRIQEPVAKPPHDNWMLLAVSLGLVGWCQRRALARSAL